MSKHTLHLTVNEVSYTLEVEGCVTLLQLLREELHLSGVKDGCSEGDCGACTVVLNGEAVKSCLILAAQVEGAHITTVEGLHGPDGDLHPIQKAFLEVGAVQCGFCTPGMLMSTYALLSRQPAPTRDQICIALSGNLCRCTGYAKIVVAVELAAKEMARTPQPEPSEEVAHG